MKLNNLEQNKLSQSDAFTRIMAIKGEIMQSGSVGSEGDNIKFILNQLKNRTITPQKAVELTEELERSRQNYH